MRTNDIGIWEKRREVEQATGRPIVYYSAYPTIGRGSIRHDFVSHEEVERRFERALHITPWQRIKWAVARFFYYA